MSGIISQILEIEKAAALVADNAKKHIDEMQKDAENQLLMQKNSADEEIRAAEADEKNKSDNYIKSQSDRIDRDTQIRIEKMNNYYKANKERILSELFDKALKS